MLQITVSELPETPFLLQVPDFLLQMAPEMLRMKERMLPNSGLPPPVLVDLQHDGDEMLRINPDMLLIIVILLQVSGVLLQIDLDLQQKIRSGPSVILEERSREDSGSLGIVVLLQNGPDLQQNEPILLQIRERGSPVSEAGAPR